MRSKQNQADKYKQKEESSSGEACEQVPAAAEYRCMSWSVLFINPIFGVVALICSSKTRNANRCGQHKSAQSWSRVTCCVIVVGLLVTITVLVVLGVYLANLLIGRNQRHSAAGGCNPELCTVETPCIKSIYGCIRGQVQTVQLADGREGKVRSFLGVPFAKPPVGELRFQDPVPMGKWGSSIKDAFHYGPSCHGTVDTAFPGFKGSEIWNPPGGRANMSEDCLYLNIWMPESRKADKLTVMIWIFGGGYFSGSASLDLYRGQFLALSQNVIVASMNYRLGSLGFLSTGDGRIKGNYGLNDQRLAIKWIHDNMDVLGGDPSSVTIMGESAGGASVGYHLVNKETTQYFTRAVMHSASQLCPWAYTRPDNAKIRAQKLFDSLNCPNTDRTALLRCLRAIPASDFVDKDWVITNVMFFPWTPTRDGDFVIADPLTDLQTTTLERKDVIVSSNKDEGTFWIVYNFPEQFTKDKAWIEITKDQLRADFEVLNEDLPPGAAKTSLYQEYANWASDTDGRRNAKLLDLILGDRDFTCPAEYFAELFTGAKRYYLEYYYRDSLESWPQWMGVIHGADCQWLFGIPLDKKLNYLSSEVTLSDQLLHYYTNFAKSGNPNGNNLPEWPEYKASSKQLLRMTPSGKFQAARFDDEFYPRSRTCAKWNAIERSSTCCSV